MTRHIHIHIHRSSAKDAWNESDHPRAANGQFGSGGGGKSSGGSKEKHDPTGMAHAGRPQGTAAVQARIEAKRAAGQPVGFERVRKESSASKAVGKPAVNASSLKEGQALYDKSGQKVDEVESIQRRSLGKGLTINTRAGYQVHIDENGTNSQGWSNEKPSAKSAPAASKIDEQAPLMEVLKELREDGAGQDAARLQKALAAERQGVALTSAQSIAVARAYERAAHLAYEKGDNKAFNAYQEYASRYRRV